MRLLLLAMLLAAAAAWALPAATEAQALTAEQARAVITPFDQALNVGADPVALINDADMTKQRQLSEEGRKVAHETETALSAPGIPIGKVYTSRLNRAIETGRLIADKDVIWKFELNDSSMGSTSAMTDSSVTGNLRAAAALRQLVNTRPEPRTNTLVVTHKTNIQDAFGKTWGDIKEGESLLFKPEGSGSSSPVARVPASDWIALAHSR